MLQGRCWELHVCPDNYMQVAESLGVATSGEQPKWKHKKDRFSFNIMPDEKGIPTAGSAP